MLTTIHITVCDRVPTITAGEDVISHNSDYVAEFVFDEEWQDKVKTVYFVCEDGSYQAVVMSGNSCDVPMMAGEHRRIFVGVQAGSAEKPSALKTTRPCCLKVKDSIADYLGQPIPDPTPDVYEQIMAMLENLTTPTWDAVQNKPFESLGDGLEVDENGVLSAKGGTGGSPNAVQYVAQELTDEQKAQARTNIGASPIPKVRYWLNLKTDNIIDLYYMGVGYGIISPVGYDQTVPTGMSSPMLVIFGEMHYGKVDITVYDGAGAVWRGSLNLSSQTTDVTKTGDYVTNTALTDILQGYVSSEVFDGVLNGISQGFNAKLDKNQGTENAGKILGVGEDGNVIPQDKPTYTLPQATADALGGIKADAATAEDTQPVRIGADGKPVTKPYTLTDADKTAVAEEVVANGIAATLADIPTGGGGTWELIGEANLTEDVSTCSFDVENYEHYEVVVALVNSTSNPEGRALEVRLNAQRGKASTASGNVIASSGTRSVWVTLIRQNGVWYATTRNNLNGNGIIDGIVENMTSFQSTVWAATELTTKVTVSSLNQHNSYFLGAGTKVKVYGVK